MPKSRPLCCEVLFCGLLLDVIMCSPVITPHVYLSAPVMLLGAAIFPCCGLAFHLLPSISSRHSDSGSSTWYSSHHIARCRDASDAQQRCPLCESLESCTSGSARCELRYHTDQAQRHCRNHQSSEVQTNFHSCFRRYMIVHTRKSGS